MASDARGLRDVTLWRYPDGDIIGDAWLCSQPDGAVAVEAVLGITVAQIEHERRVTDKAVRERDEARAELARKQAVIDRAWAALAEMPKSLAVEAALEELDSEAGPQAAAEAAALRGGDGHE